MPDLTRVTRRSLLTGLIGSALPASAFSRSQIGNTAATPQGYGWSDPIDLGNGFELLDWRTSITNDTTRFLAEIRNTSDQVVVAPTIGVILPGLPDSGNYGWANPFTPVIHAGESTFVIGITPAGANHDSHWDGAEWIVCESSETASDFLDTLDDLEYELDSSTAVHRPDWMQCSMSVINVGSDPIWSMRLVGIVRDANDRIAGGTAFSSLTLIEQDETMEMVVNVSPMVEMTASPFDFVSDLSGGSATFSVQPRGHAVNHGCPAVMPWNR